MAIIVEEGKNKTGVVSFLIWILILGLITAAVYYVFFKNPDIVGVLTPAGFQNTAALSKINLKPEEIINSAQFQSLKQYVSLPTIQNAGRANPFLGF